MGSLARAMRDAKPDIVVPCDDGVVWQLHSLYDQHPELKTLIERSLGSPVFFSTIRSRGGLLDLGKACGLRVPKTTILNSGSDLTQWFGSPRDRVVLKLDGTWGGSGVSIVDSLEEAETVFRKLKEPLRFSYAMKRFVVNRDPLAFWSRSREQKRDVTIQEYITGRPANAMMVCLAGEVLGTVTVEVISSQGSTGAANVVRFIKNSEIARACAVLARELGLTGFHGLDFILEEGSGAAYLIELNPRCTQLGHLRLPVQGDLAGAFGARLTGKIPLPVIEPIHGETVAFFPQAISWNPKSPYISSGYHDVPWEEPRLVRELMLEAWPNRQWPARLYHSLRPPERQVEVEYGVMETRNVVAK